MNTSRPGAAGPISTGLVAIAVALSAMASPATAKTEVKGDIHSVTLRVENGSIDETLKALEASFGLRYRAPGNLAKTISGSYQGSLKDVVKRVLDGYDFVLTTRGTAIELAVIGKSAAAAPVGAPAQVKAPVSKPTVTVQQTPKATANLQVAALEAEQPNLPVPVDMRNAADGPVPFLIADNDPSKMPTPNANGSTMPMPTPSASADGPVPRPNMSSSASMPMPTPDTSGNGPVPMPPTAAAQPTPQPGPAPQPAAAPKSN